MKVIINNCYGGFSISPEALLMLINRKSEIVKKMTFKEYYGTEKKKYATYDTPKIFKDGYEITFTGCLIKDNYIYFLNSDEREEVRAHPDLIKAVNQLGKRANGSCADLKIVKIPDDVEWEIKEYDGNEWIAEKHRTWN